MSTDRRMVRCLGCGKWTRRSRCSLCRHARKALKIDPNGRQARKIRRRDRARGVQ